MCIKMDLKRFFAEEKIEGDTVVLRGDEFYHAVKVTRHKVGYKLIVCDNGKFDYYATVTEIGKDYLTAHVDEVKENDVELPYKLTLYIGNNKDLDVVTQKAVEMGVTEIVPFVSQHCNIKTVAYDRLRKVISESAKQCGRSCLPVLREQMDFDEVLTDLTWSEVFAFYEYERENKVKDAKLVHGKDISIIIGCEGGFAVEEIEKMKERGITTYTLGKRIMRVATAVVAACALVNEKAEE